MSNPQNNQENLDSQKNKRKKKNIATKKIKKSVINCRGRASYGRNN